MPTLITQNPGLLRDLTQSAIPFLSVSSLFPSVTHSCIQGSLHSNGERRRVPSNSIPPHPPIPCIARFLIGWLIAWLRGNLLDCILTTHSLIPHTTVTCSCNHSWILKHFSSMISPLLTPLCHFTPLITSGNASLSLTSGLFCLLFSFSVPQSSFSVSF